MIFAEVILPIALDGTFTYHVPPEFEDRLGPGMRVEVNFGKSRNFSGIVHHLHRQKPAISNIKPIISIIDDKPILSQDSLDIWDWVADYYMCPLGQVMDAALPAYLKMSSETIFYLNPLTELQPESLSDAAYLVYEALLSHEHLMRKDVEDILDHQKVYKTVKELQDLRAIFTIESLKDKAKVKTEKKIRLSPDNNNPQGLEISFNKLKKAPKQESLMLLILQKLDRQDAIPKKEITQHPTYSSAAYNALIKKNIIEEEIQEVGRVNYQAGERKTIRLNEEQQKVFSKIEQSSEKVHLIDGITGSGKTFIYLKLILAAIRKGKQVLYLVPEIALTTQLIQNLLDYLGDDLAVYHSKFNAQERVEIYNKVGDGNAKVILGVRSAVLLPFRELDLIIVDEEHENTYKQNNPAPRYNARDVALHLSKKIGAKCVLGSATPSVNMLFLAQKSKIEYHQLKNRYLKAQLPEVEVVDTKKEHTQYRDTSIFSARLIEEIQKSLTSHKQVILFQNRRGFNPFIICGHCGSVPSCSQCDVSLTYHKLPDHLLCHYCNQAYPPLHTCPSCGQQALKTFSFGTEKVEDEIQKLFPQVRVARMDYDTTRNKNAHEKIIRQFQDHRIDILIGTQMITKGLNFMGVNLVGILSADSMMSYPNYRAHEQAIQTWTQVAGRAGRAEGPSKVLIQTLQPHNRLILQFKDAQYHDFVKNEFKERQEMIYPPYCKLIRVVFRHKDKNILDAAANHFFQQATPNQKYTIKRPIDANIARIRDKYIMETYVKIPNRISNIRYTKQNLSLAKQKTLENKNFKYVNIHFDVDPM